MLSPSQSLDNSIISFKYRPHIMQLIVLLLSLTVLIWLARRLLPMLLGQPRARPHVAPSPPRADQKHAAPRVVNPALSVAYCEQAQRAYEDMQQLDRDECRRDAPAYRQAAVASYQDMQSRADKEILQSRRLRKMAAVLRLAALGRFNLIPRKWLARTGRSHMPHMPQTPRHGK